MKYFKNAPFALVTLALILFGGMKIIGAEQMLQNMGNLHYPEWFTRLLGLSEIAFAAGLWSEKTRSTSILLLFGIFSGAIGSHFGHGDGLTGAIPALVCLSLTAVCYGIHTFQK